MSPKKTAKLNESEDEIIISEENSSSLEEDKSLSFLQRVQQRKEVPKLQLRKNE
jgi:hypothetical protein